MVVEELISLLKIDIDPSSISKLGDFSAMLETGIWGLVGALAAIPAAVAGASAGLVAIGIKSAATMEMTTAEITTMLDGNSQQAKALISDINQFANVTPFETGPLVDNAKTMMSMGIAAGDTVKYMKLIGDVAGGNQEKMSRFVYNFSQIKSLGKLQGEDLRQFATGGFNPLKALIEGKGGHAFTDDELKKKVDEGTMSMETFKLVHGKTMAQLQDMASKGKIGFQQMVDAFQMATAKGGLFYGNLARMAATVEGRWSTFMDAVKQNLRDIGGKFLPFVSRALDALAKMLDYIGPLWVDIVDDMRVFFASTTDSSVEDWAQDLTIALEVLLETTADLIYLFLFLFRVLKVGFLSVAIIMQNELQILAKQLYVHLIYPLERVLVTMAKIALAAHQTRSANNWANAASGLMDLGDKIRAIPEKINTYGISENDLADSLNNMTATWNMIGKDYAPRVAKPNKFEQNNTINQNINIDPKADPTGRTSLHIKGLKEAVRSAFNIEVMQILTQARTA